MNSCPRHTLTRACCQSRHRLLSINEAMIHKLWSFHINYRIVYKKDPFRIAMSMEKAVTVYNLLACEGSIRDINEPLHDI